MAGPYVYPLGKQATLGDGPAGHAKRAYGNWQSDNAVDMKVPVGTPVYAVTGGQIAGGGYGFGLSKNQDDPNLAGLRVHLVGSDGNMFYYQHLSKFAPGIEPGAPIKAGQLIGYSGTAGDPPVPHLHFGVRGSLSPLDVIANAQPAEGPSSTAGTGFWGRLKDIVLGSTATGSSQPKEVDQQEAEQRDNALREQYEQEQALREQEQQQVEQRDTALGEQYQREQADAQRQQQQQADAQRQQQEQTEAQGQEQEQADAQRQQQQQTEAQRQEQEQADDARRDQEQAEDARQDQKQAEDQRQDQEQADDARQEQGEAQAQRQEEAERQEQQEQAERQEQQEQAEHQEQQEQAEHGEGEEQQEQMEQQRQIGQPFRPPGEG